MNPRHATRGGRRSGLWPTFALAAAALATGGCGPLRSANKLAGTYAEVARSGERGDALVVPAFDVPPPATRARFTAGAASEDITPPPGFPTGGHGPAGDVARGYWTRLRARAFFFEDRSGRALALVSADLFAIPAGLQAQVARLVAARLAERRLPAALGPEALVIAATHTHHGPGNFLTSRIYNQFGSSYPGFSRELFDFLAERVARAVVAAVEDARAHDAPVEVAVHERRVGFDLVRNRAPWTFTLNQDRDALLAALSGGGAPPACEPLPDEPRDHWELPGCPRLRAADRALTVAEVVRVDGAHRTTVGALVFFAAHPTVLPPASPLYGGDFAEYALLSVEASLAAGGASRPVVAFFNGAEGDVTARRRRRDLRDAAALGDAFAREVSAALRAAPARALRDPALSVRARRWRFADAAERACGAAGAASRLSASPAFGVASLGGAEDDRTPLFALGWRDGVRDRAFDDQGPKLPALDSRLVRGLRFTHDFAPEDAFPEALPLTLASIGDLTLAAVPVEMTTAQGQALRSALGLPRGRLEIVGLANEYASYCTSQDEYAAQDYAGASTLFGPDEGRFLACRAAELAGAPESATRHVPERAFWPGVAPRERFGRAFTSALAARPDAGLEHVLRDRGGLPERRLPWFAWEERGPAPELEQTAARRVAVRALAAGAWRDLEDDRGASFLTVYLGDGRWAAIWLGPLLRDGVAGTFSFAVSAGGATRCSRAFEIAPGAALPDRVEAAASCDAEGRPGS